MKSIIAERPRELVSVDILGPFPTARLCMKYLFVTVDVFSKYIQVYPVKRPTAKACTNIIVNKYIKNFGPIEKIISDHGIQFTAHEW